MLPRRGLFFVVMICVFTLAGCFQQASDDFESVPADGQGSQQVVPTDVPPPTIDDSGITIASATPMILEPPTETPLAVDNITPTDDIPPVQVTEVEASATSVVASSNTPLPPPTLDTSNQNQQPTNTIPPAQPSATATPQTDSPTSTPTFVTPGSVQGPIETVAPTATGTPIGGVTTNNGLPPTPTGIFIPTDDCLYVVQAGDNLYRISVNNDVTLTALRNANPQITGDLIQPGDELILPVEGCTADGISVDTSNDDDDTVSDTSNEPLPDGIQAIHVVQAGETLNIIARRYGVTITAIARENGITDVNRLALDQELRIPIPPEESN